ncbi:hypothetical protein C453_12741 [Haloferax elongans ATCC BAA-1513]|uniref:Adenylate kinase n=1 Tax=Haloferax elongans ATCC BAA-1513 TaxID=1230453 RepID=M0HKU0_HALEO|nr:AAA family ATPase [Haloferax elongans]ELZ84413.1 hypothetical protein C453_12741 [Haloferax elongans ATCC BAA-1513]
MSESRDRYEAPTKNLRKGVVVIGLPGAGKSTAGEMLADELDAIELETGDIVREGARDHFDVDSTDDLSSDALGDYSTMRRDVDGGDYVAQDIIDRLEAADAVPAKPVVVIGMRDTEAIPALELWFDSLATVWVHAPFDERLDRLQGRGRQDESDFDADDLVRRDGRESMWGTPEWAFWADAKLRNEWGVDALREQVTNLAVRLSFASGDAFHERTTRSGRMERNERTTCMEGSDD